VGYFPFVTPSSSGGFANPMTTLGDLISGGSGGAAQRLAVGTNSEVLSVVGGVPAWSAAAAGGLAPSGDTSGATDYANITGLLTLAGAATLQAGTFYTDATIMMTNNQAITGAGVGETILTSATDVVLIQMGNEQSDHIMRNWMRLGGMTVNQTGGTQTHANVKIDGGGRGTTIQKVSTGGGKYGFELMDLDRCYFEDISANNPGTAGIFLEVGFQNTYGTCTFVNCDAVLSNSNTYGWYTAPNADQASPNQLDRMVFIGCMAFKTSGLTGCIGFYDTIGMTSANFIGGLWEQNNRQFRTDGTGSTVNFLGCTFLDSTTTCTDIAYLNGSGTFTFRDCRFQQATNCFNGVSGSPSVCLEGKNNNQGGLTNLFTGTFTSKMGTDTVFAGDATLALGLNNQRFGLGFIDSLIGNPVKIYPSADGSGAINFLKADGVTVVGQFNTTTGAFTLATPLGIASGGTGQTTAAAAFNALNPNAAPFNGKVAAPAGTVSGSQVMMGCGSVCAYTPTGSGLVSVTVTTFLYNATATQSDIIGPRYGTGSAPANGAALTGTRWGCSTDPAVRPSVVGASETLPVAFTDVLSLTPGTAYWFDLSLLSGSTSDEVFITNVSMSIIELPAG
jgi:hypothetical protein